MQAYSAKLTIDGLYGPFAEKYAKTIHNAHYMHALLLKIGARAKDGPIAIFEFSPQTRTAEAFPLLPRFLKYLNKIAVRQPDRRFFTGVYSPDHSPTPHQPLPASRTSSDDTGNFTLHAFGTRAFVEREGEEGTVDLTHEEVPQFGTGDNRLLCRYDTFKHLFADDLENLVTICEEAMGKDAHIILTFSPHEA